MPINIPTSEEMRTAFLGDIELGAIEEGISDPPIEPGSDWYLLGTAVANVALVQNQNVRIAENDSSVLTAEGQELDDIRVANGLPELVATGATGYVRLKVYGSTTIVAGEEAIAKANGLRYATVTTTTDPADGAEIEMVAVDSGEDTNLDSGEVLTWANTPPNVSSTITVSNTVPFLGGRDDETDDEKRARILERKRNPPAGGNWSQLVEVAKASLSSVQGAYVYPALGGPSSLKLALTKAIIPEDDDYTRTPTDAMVRIVRAAIQGVMPDGNAVVIQGAADETSSVSLTMDLPDSVGAGGNGTGWVNDTVWPDLSGSDTEITVATVTDSKTITLAASTTTDPVAGQTQIAWWSPHTQSFYVRTIVAESWSGSDQITLDKPLIDDKGNIVSVGDYISPAAVSIGKYGASWRGLMGELGPGENTTDSNLLYVSARRPHTDAADSPTVGDAMLRSIQKIHPEISALSISAATPSTPTVPASVDTAPNVLRLNNLGIYAE